MGFRVEALGLAVEGLGFRGLGFRVEGLGVRVEGLGFKGLPFHASGPAQNDRLIEIPELTKVNRQSRNPKSRCSPHHPKTNRQHQ